MKCATKVCMNEAVIDRMFCVDCSAHLKASRNLNLIPSKSHQDLSSIRALGEASDPFSDEEDSLDYEQERSDRPHESESREDSTGLSTRNEYQSDESFFDNPGEMSESESRPRRPLNEERKIMRITEKHGTPGTRETKSPTPELSEFDESSEILPMVSSTLPINLDEERSRSMSLIDKSARHLYRYMKSLGNDTEQRPQLKDFRQINAVANLGKQIANLAKIKLDAVKEARKEKP